MSLDDHPSQHGFSRRDLIRWTLASGSALIPATAGPRWPALATFAQAPMSAAAASSSGPSTARAKFWWDQWPRFNSSSDLGNAVATDSNVLTAFLQDEGRGAYFRIITFDQNQQTVQEAAADGVMYIPWLEGMGQTRAIIGAVNRLPDGSYQPDPTTGLPALIATNWTWDQSGPGRNAQANTIVWMGVFSWMNRESWQGSAVAPAGFPVPTYPDGTPAIGYLNDDPSDPRNSRLLDALGARDLNGNLAIQYSPLPASAGTTKNTTGELAIPSSEGTVQYAGDFSLGKDFASQWWVQYNNLAAQYFIERGAAGFWVDNYNGWDFIGNAPNTTAFGNWSVARFRDRLAAHPIAGHGALDIRTYLKGTFAQWFPTQDSTDLSAAGWADERWITDPIWIEYKLFKSDISGQTMRAHYQGIKSAAQAAGVDPDTIYVGGNDIGKLNFGAETGEGQLDQVNIEYDPLFSPVTGANTDGLPPYGQAAPYYRLVQQYGQATPSPHNIVWYYLWEASDAPYQDDSTLGDLLTYEALANDALLNHGSASNQGLNYTPGNPTSTNINNQVIERLAPVFGDRQQAGQVGLFFSPQTEFRDLAPGGYIDGGRLDHTLGYYGWGNALVRLNIPYKVLPEFRLTPGLLGTLSTLVLPNVYAISDQSLGLLTSWVRRGGRIIVTGAQSGAFRSLADRYAQRTKASLVELVSASSSRSVYTADNLGMTYYLSSNRSADDLAPIGQVIDQVSAGSGQSYTIDVTALGPKVVANLHTGGGGGTRLFVDLLNEDITLDPATRTGSLASTTAGTAVLPTPHPLSKAATATWWDADSPTAVPTPMRASASQVEITVPSFRVYGVIVVDA